MTRPIIFLSLPGLRPQDLARLPQLAQWAQQGDQRTLISSFPAVTWPVQANMLTGVLPREHGVIANGFYWRERREVEMWTAWNDVIQAPQIWDRLKAADAGWTSAVWFPMLSKGCGADYVCMPAPIHNPDGSESLWCYTQPTELYGDFRDVLGHFPLQHFWGPLANIRSTDWIVDSAVQAAERFRPNLFYLYLPHLDYAAQKRGPDSDEALGALAELNSALERLSAGLTRAYGDESLVWLAASEYVITRVDHVTYPNRRLREAGLLAVEPREDGEHLDLATSRAWALVDHQLSHVFLSDPGPDLIGQVVDLFRGQPGIDEVLAGEQRAKYQLDHERAGEIVLVSSPNSWQAYYWWLEDQKAPGFARRVDIHSKPGYDPVELHFDVATKSIPLDARLIRGSHGAPARHPSQHGIVVASDAGLFSGRDASATSSGGQPLRDIDIAPIVLAQFGIT
jgi:predicted AlkP superfamily pyrophosphatase or phosphodiesterase